MVLINHTSCSTTLKTYKTIFLVSKYPFAMIWKEFEWQDNYSVYRGFTLIASGFVVQCYRKDHIILLLLIAYDVVFGKSMKSLKPGGQEST